MKSSASAYPVCASIQNILFKNDMKNIAAVEYATSIQEIVVF